MSVKFEDFTIVVKDITGGNKKYVSTEYLSEGKYPIIDQGEKFIGGYIDDEEVVKRDKDIVIFGDHTKVLKYVDFDFCLGADGVKVLQPNDKLTSKFLFYFLHTIELPNVGYSRHFKFLKETKIPLPPLETQKAIAEKLDKADALRKKDQELLKQYDELAQSIFIDMFGDPVQNEKGWGMITIKESVELITYGLTIRPEYLNEGIPLISAREIRSGYINYSDAPKISIKDFNNLTAKGKPSKGDILFSKTGTIGLSSVVDKNIKFAITQNCARMKFKSQYYNSNFVLEILRNDHFLKKCKQLVKGNAVKDLQLGDFSKMLLIIPPLELQNQFAEKIKNIEAQKELVKKQAEASENLFQALLQESFSFT
ncbi:restriction endonuclease subunit S [Empedobacter falsenii]